MQDEYDQWVGTPVCYLSLLLWAAMNGKKNKIIWQENRKILFYLFIYLFHFLILLQKKNDILSSVCFDPPVGIAPEVTGKS